MKKVLLISVLALFTFSSCVCVKYANVEDEDSLRYSAGDVTLGGKFHYSSETQDDFKDSEARLRPYIGTLLTDNLEVGVRAGLTSGKSEQGSFEDKWTSFNAGPYVRYYWCDDYRLVPYVDFGANYLSNNFKTAGYKQNGFGAKAGLGMSYVVNKWLALTADYTAISYQSLSDDRDGVPNINSFNASLNASRVNFGIQTRF